MNGYNRTADEKIYLENRYEQPKESFKQVVALLKLGSKENNDPRKTFIDIGCATGEFLYYVRKINPKIILRGVEYSPKLVSRSKKFLRKHNIEITKGDANDLKMQDSQYDFVTELGVTLIFDDFRPSFREMIRVAKNNARCLNFLLLNELDIDVMIKYINPKTQKIESGWNKFSMRSVDKFLKSHPNVKNYKFIKHRMPLDIPKGKDLMRSWTVKDKRGRRILWNGLNMEISIYHVLFNVQK